MIVAQKFEFSRGETGYRIGVAELFDEIQSQIHKLREDNYIPKILIIYSPLLHAIQYAVEQIPGVRREITGVIIILGLNVIPVDYEIENYVKVY